MPKGGLKMSDDETSIRERAYFLWLAAGQPDGHDLDHWHQACAESDGYASVSDGREVEAQTP